MQLQQLLSDSYLDEHWCMALDTIMNAEGDITQASVAVEKLAAVATHQTGIIIKIPAPHLSQQLATAAEEILGSIKTLKDHNWIFGTLMTIDEILSAKEENKIGEPMYQFEDDAAIAAEVQHQMAVEQGDIIEINSNEEEDLQPKAAPIAYSEIIQLCKKLEMACIS
ncbi:hypothetical protein PAXRUDRAFT_15866 [Paxillus rubicundulus Ve08.2h10]|uniref:Uncharacterized protein n=1 Tax=Paxillus rubicundulus Ve08.2h10 TaxID=930991 RepID=A0A0D0DNP3_9AGAM|nr:hypothetical protein PAXRUDRAFT_15866 [Paxillus rubicundulus Ve08.2h10]